MFPNFVPPRRDCQYCGKLSYVVDFNAKGQFVFDALCHDHYNELSRHMHKDPIFAASNVLEGIYMHTQQMNVNLMSYANWKQQQFYGVATMEAMGKCHESLRKWDAETSDSAALDGAKEALTK